MTGLEVVQAIQKQNIHNLLTPLAVALAIKVSAAKWSTEENVRYGTRVRDEIRRLAETMEIQTTEEK